MPTQRKNPQELAARQLLKLLCLALDEKKAEDLLVLDVSKQSSITNYLIIATGTSEPHLRALRNELDRVIDETGTRVVGVDARGGSGWTVVDAFDVMVHVLTPENRTRYRLESLWGDAPKLEVRRLLAKPPTRRPAAKKTARTKATADGAAPPPVPTAPGSTGADA